MASHAESVVTRAVRAHLDRDEPLALQALETDKIIDQFEIQIDRIALALLAQNPGEMELRQIACGMKIAQDLERVGDEATTIASRSNWGRRVKCSTPESEIACVPVRA